MTIELADDPTKIGVSLRDGGAIKKSLLIWMEGVNMVGPVEFATEAVKAFQLIDNEMYIHAGLEKMAAEWLKKKPVDAQKTGA